MKKFLPLLALLICATTRSALSQEKFPLPAVPPSVTEYNRDTGDALARILEILRGGDRESSDKISDLADDVLAEILDLRDQFNARGASPDEIKWLTNECRTWLKIREVAPQLGAASTQMALCVFNLDREIHNHRTIFESVLGKSNDATRNLERVRRETGEFAKKFDDVMDDYELVAKHDITKGVVTVSEIYEKHFDEIDSIDSALLSLDSFLRAEYEADWGQAVTAIQAVSTLAQKTNENVIKAKAEAGEQQRRILLLRESVTKMSIDTNTAVSGEYDKVWAQWTDIIDNDYARFVDFATKVENEFTTTNEKIKKLSIFAIDKGLGFITSSHVKIDDLKTGLDPQEKLLRSINLFRNILSSARRALLTALDRKNFSKEAQVRLLIGSYDERIKSISAKWDKESLNEQLRIKKLLATAEAVEEPLRKQLAELAKEIKKYEAQGDQDLIKATKQRYATVEAELLTMEDLSDRDSREYEVVEKQIKESFTKQLQALTTQWKSERDTIITEWSNDAKKSNASADLIKKNRKLLEEDPKRIGEQIDALYQKVVNYDSRP